MRGESGATGCATRRTSPCKACADVDAISLDSSRSSSPRVELASSLHPRCIARVTIGSRCRPHFDLASARTRQRVRPTLRKGLQIGFSSSDAREAYVCTGGLDTSEFRVVDFARTGTLSWPQRLICARETGLSLGACARRRRLSTARPTSSSSDAYGALQGHRKEHRGCSWLF